MNKRSSFAERLDIVSQVQNGKTIRLLSFEYGYSRETITRWVKRFNRYGLDGLRDKPKKMHSGKIKEQAARQIIEKGVPLVQVALEHFTSRSTVECWVNKARKDGYSSLYGKEKSLRKRDFIMAKSKLSGPENKEQISKAKTSSHQACSSLLLDSFFELLQGAKKWSDKIDVIEKFRQEIALKTLLSRAKISRSVYYYHRKKDKTPQRYVRETELIKSIFHEHKGRYGYRRITQELHNRGICINHKTVSAIMKKLNIKCTIRQVRYRSYKGTVGKVAPNLLNRNFKATAPNQKWATDVTQINIGGTKLYLSPIIDLYNGEIISYTISGSANLKQVCDMLKKAFKKHKKSDNLLLHSDQGWQYQHYQYRLLLSKRNIIQSMSNKGNCLDNAIIENFFGIMKSELLYKEKFKDAEEFIKALDKYILYYNKKRIKMKLGGKSPVQYRVLNNTNK